MVYWIVKFGTSKHRANLYDIQEEAMEVENLVYLTIIFLVVMVILIHSCMLRSTVIRILTNLKPTITIKTSPPSHSQYRCRKKLLKRKANGDALIDDRQTIHNPELYFSNPCQR